jgi:hypothetical protein
MKRAIICVLPVGAAGGALLSLAGLVTPVIGMSLGCVYGLVFCLVVGRRAGTPGGACYGVSHLRCSFGWLVRRPSDPYLCPRYQGRRLC